MISVSGGSDPVSVALTEDVMVVSCAPGWTEQDWTDALIPHQHIEAHLAGMTDEVDGTEIFIFAIATEVAA
jgi:hypothetical protein